MSTPKWVKDAIFYQIFPDRFAKSDLNPARNLPFEEWDSAPTHHGFKGGDLYGVIEQLDYLQELGINAIYLNPIFASASNHRYHTFDYYNVDPLLGGNDALKKLLKEAHRRDIRIVLDGVFNHASRGFWQFNHVLETGVASPYRDWFYFDGDRLYGRKHWGAYPTREEEKALQNEDSLTAIGYRGWWNLPALPKFNIDTPAVREYLFEVAEYWIKFGIDGWRLDVPGEIDDDEFWREFRRRVRAINPDAYIVGRAFGEAAQHVAHDFANEVDRILNLYPTDITFAQLNLLDSHDMPRFLSCASGNKDSLKLAWLFMFTIPGAPCIYYGDESGLDGGQDPECRKAFPWQKSKWDNDLLGYIKSLIKLRTDLASLRKGDYKRLFADGAVMAYARTHKNEDTIIVFNVSEEDKTVELPIENKPRILFGKPKISGKQVTIPARSGAVIK